MCICQTWVRIPTEETARLPISNHAPGCLDYTLERFVRISIDGTSCIYEPADAQRFIEDGGDDLVIGEVSMTRDQFENLAEFSGF